MRLATKENTAKLSIFAISLLIVMKVVVSIVTGSISIRADAVHSIIDLSGVVIGFIGIRISGKPPDERHPFGHGKAENIAGVVITGLIFDLHLVVPKDVSVERAHQICDQLEEDIQVRLSYASVTIHCEPCDGQCGQCPIPPDQCNYKS